MAKDIEEVKLNTTSEKNIKTLDKVEKAIDTLSGLLEGFSFVRGKEPEERPAAPETPMVTMPDAIKYEHIRKRGGRVVKRQVKEGK
jgi:hypothetical protein